MIKKLKLKELNQLLTLADKITISFILFISLFMIFAAPYLLAGNNEAKEAVITIRGEELARYEISERKNLERINFEFEIDGADYQGVLKMKDGAVRLERLSKDIVPLAIHNDMGWISKRYETIVAMPIGMVINIEDSIQKQDDSEIDIMAF